MESTAGEGEKPLGWSWKSYRQLLATGPASKRLIPPLLAVTLPQWRLEQQFPLGGFAGTRSRRVANSKGETTGLALPGLGAGTGGLPSILTTGPPPDLRGRGFFGGGAVSRFILQYGCGGGCHVSISPYRLS